YIVELAPGGGSDHPELDAAAEGALFVVEGELSVSLAGKKHSLRPGGFAFLPPASGWTVRNESGGAVRFHWIRKTYDAVDGIDTPQAFFANEQDIAPSPMPGTEGRWATTRFVDPADMRHDMHVTIVTLEPGAVIPFAETHVMEHGLYVLEGKAVYRLNQDWVEVEAGDYMWLRAFCPQACYAGGPGKFRYLLYKDVNRHAKLGSAGVARPTP
ncbi:MAG: (S)-ureidoglycine aminohydrolase, partial [Mesorhizobium sp.]